MTYRTHKPTIALAIFAASAVAGCTSPEGNFSNGPGIPTEAANVTLALLTNDAGMDCIEIVDVANQLDRTIVLDTSITQARDFASQPGGDCK